jgi:hypothetical protein
MMANPFLVNLPKHSKFLSQEEVPMSDSWQKAYGELKDYIVKNPSIEISEHIIAISADVRPGFYQLFNTVNLNFIKDNFPTSLEQSYALSKNWGEVSQATKDSLKLEALDAETSARFFLLDPGDGLVRGLFDPLFDLLKGKTNLAGFEQTATQILEHRLAKFSHEGYQDWAILSLLKLLATDRIYQAIGSKLGNNLDIDDSSHPGELDGSQEENVPDSAEVHNISFEHSLMSSFLVPKIIGHSTRLKLFIAFGFDFDFTEAGWRARKLSQELEWYKTQDILLEFGRGNLWPDLAIYTNTQREEIIVMADFFQIARPDIIVEFREKKDWYEKGGLELVKRHYNVLKPKLGSFVVCREAVPEDVLKELEPKSEPQPAAENSTPKTTAQPALNLHFLNVGFDIPKLEPIIESIIQAQAKPKEATAEDATT